MTTLPYEYLPLGNGGDQTGGSGPRSKPNLPRLQTALATMGAGDPPRSSYDYITPGPQLDTFSDNL